MFTSMLAAIIAGVIGFLLLFIIIILVFLCKAIRRKGNYILQKKRDINYSLVLLEKADCVYIIFIFCINLKYRIIITMLFGNIFIRTYLCKNFTSIFIVNCRFTLLIFPDAEKFHPKVDANGNCESDNKVSHLLLFFCENENMQYKSSAPTEKLCFCWHCENFSFYEIFLKCLTFGT